MLLVAAVVAMVAQRLRVPNTVGLVAAGVALVLTKSLIFTAPDLWGRGRRGGLRS